jgi:general secretion pathway protein A
MIYEHYFALTQRPFSIAPNPNFLYACGQYKEALAALEYGMLHRGGFVLLTGEVGTGKTTLCKFLLKSVPQDTEVALVLHPQLDRIELLQLICKEFGLDVKGDLKESDLIEQLTGFLLSVYSKGGYSVLIIDEAQHLDDSVLELVRLLTNLETHEDKLLQIILLGQPELRSRLNQYQLRQLNQRFTARFHLDGLSFLQVKAYLDHRVEVAGGHESLFSTSAAWLLYRLTKGIPRLINVLADRCLMGCYAQQKKQVTPLMVWRASKEVLPMPQKSNKSLLKIAALSAVCIGVLSVTNFSYYVEDNIVKPLFNSDAISALYLYSENTRRTELKHNPCSDKPNCWTGQLPVSVVSNSLMQGQVLLDGQWQNFSAQSLPGEQVSVLLSNVDRRYLDGLIKPFQQDVLIPWVRDVLLSQEHGLNGEDVSQWQIIAPQSASTGSSLVYDGVLRDLVKSFQRRHGLLVDGVLGPQTLISLSLWDQQAQMAAQ